MNNVIYTYGHSARAFSEFLKGLKENNIEILIDCRTHPHSRFCPWFNQKALSEGLNKESITYLFKGKNLGGMGENIDYEKTIGELVEMVKKGKKVCVMCSEKDYRKCHRFLMLTPSFETMGVKVEHIE
ncbi:MAG: DUF488 domain-containing protein [Candidatus Paceibacterota bacterium]|jgi:uncharacterized protein (DUF488 family)